MAVGYLIGGGTGMMIALVIAAATNLFSYWNSDKLVLSMHQAQEVDEQSVLHQQVPPLSEFQGTALVRISCRFPSKPQ